jgi:hypothetical protein
MFKADIEMLDKLDEIFTKREEQHGSFLQTEEEELDQELDGCSEFKDSVRIEDDGDYYYFHYYE